MSVVKSEFAMFPRGHEKQVPTLHSWILRAALTGHFWLLIFCG